jgi:hypothetical protein
MDLIDLLLGRPLATEEEKAERIGPAKGIPNRRRPADRHGHHDLAEWRHASSRRAFHLHGRQPSSRRRNGSVSWSEGIRMPGSPSDTDCLQISIGPGGPPESKKNGGGTNRYVMQADSDVLASDRYVAGRPRSRAC